MNNQTETQPPVMIAAMFQQCEGQCGAVVRIDERFCALCAEFNHMYELKRLAAWDRPVDLSAAVARAKRRESFHNWLTIAAIVFVCGLLSAPWFMGCCDLWQDIFGR
jgi:hypothetical protein